MAKLKLKVDIFIETEKSFTEERSEQLFQGSFLLTIDPGNIVYYMHISALDTKNNYI